MKVKLSIEAKLEFEYEIEAEDEMAAVMEFNKLSHEELLREIASDPSSTKTEFNVWAAVPTK